MADADKRGSWEREAPQQYLQGLFDESSTQKHPLGTRRRLSDGREFIYVQAGTSNLAAGQLVQGEVCDVANLANLAVTANQAAGNKVIALTVGDSTEAATANAFAEGYAYINTGAGNGCVYKINHHAAIAANANGNMYLSDKLRVAITTSSKVSLYKHPCKKVIVHPSPPTASLVGVPTFVVTANYYAWIQTKGPAAVEVEEGSGAAVVEGELAFASPGANGCVTGCVDNANAIDTQTTALFPVGRVMANNANDHWALIDLDL